MDVLEDLFDDVWLSDRCDADLRINDPVHR